MMEQTQMDLAEGRRQRDDAVARVAAHADAEWMQVARAALLFVIARGLPFTTDDVWTELRDRGWTKPAEPRALGAVLKTAANEGRIVKTGDYHQSSRPECHASPKAVWRPTGRW